MAGQIQVIERREDQEMPDGIPNGIPELDCSGNKIFNNFETAYARLIDIVWREHSFRPMRALVLGLSSTAGIFAGAFPSNSIAQTLTDAPSNLSNSPQLIEKMANVSFGTGEVMLLALFGGAMSFALLAAFWLIRERNRVTDENRLLGQTVSIYKATNERNEALVNVVDQRVVLWNGVDEAPSVIGSLSISCGAPLSKTEFLCFGKWIASTSCKAFEDALFGLRKKADAFDMPLQTIGGGVIEAQGRTSGAYAFVRFIELSGDRAALARLQAEHSALLTTFDSVQDLFNRLDMQVWLSNKDGSISWANEAYTKAVEATDGIAVVDNDSRLFDQAERTEINAGLTVDGFFNGPLPAIISGDRKIVDVVEVTSENGGAGIAVDKSQVEDIRNALKHTIASHATTLDQLATPIAIFDMEKNLQFYNSSFQQLWKLDSGFLESKPSNADVLGAMREEKRLPPIPDWRKWRDGQLEIYQALETRIEWWHLPDGKTLRVVVNPQTLGGATWIFEDVTEQLELKSSYNSLVRVQGETLDHLSEAVAVFSSDGKLRLSNSALWKMLQVDEARIKPGTHINALTKHLTEKIRSLDIWEDIVSNITGYDDERGNRSGRLYLQNGKIMEFALVPLPDGRTMLTLLDVTANVNIELALTQRNEALEEAGNLKNRFLKHVSYELRTPLTTISGFGELLSMKQTGKLNAIQSDYLDHINTSSSVLKAIIDDILDLATIDAGAMELELKKFEIEPAIASVVENLSPALEKNHVSISTQIAPAATHLIADNTRFRQIIYNLISNAIKHSPDGGNISVCTSAKEGNILVSISDQGPGVPTSERSMIFTRFESSAKGDGRRGAGLGLSIVKSFMKLHDGDIHIEPAEGRGAKFTCIFPASPEQISQAAQ